MARWLALPLALLIVTPSFAGAIVPGTGEGAGSKVSVFSGPLVSYKSSFAPFASTFTGGVRVATGDVTGDGVADIVAGLGPGAGPHVRVFDGSSGAVIHSFFAFDPSFSSGVYVAAGDINNDGFDDIVTGAGAGGGPHVRVFDGSSQAELSSFFAYSTGFTGGVRVAAGDVNNDGYDDIITGAGSGAGGHVKVFDGSTGLETQSFLAFTPSFTGGIFVAAGDVNNDGFADIITGADAGAAPHVKVFDGNTGGELMSFFAFDAGFTGGVRVASADLNGDGFADIITGAGPGSVPHVKVFDGASGAVMHNFLAFNSAFTGGVFVAGSSLETPEVLPEPGSVWLMLAGGLGLVGWSRRKRT